MVGFEDVEVDIIKIAILSRVIGIALHQNQLRIDAQDGMHSPLHITNGGGPRG